MDPHPPLPTTFDCPQWQESNGHCCPEGAIRSDCPEIKGYWLEQERAWANQPCKVTPNHFVNGLAVVVSVAAIFAALWAANAAMGVPQ
tara:strand:+ start:1156 stop:1419 length:264 start_codon:yes stop_codon:yes gene_type:complete